MPSLYRCLTLGVTLGVAIVTPMTVRAQPPSALRWADSSRIAIEAAAIGGDLARLREARAFVERALVRYPGDPLLLHYQGYALYREGSQLIGRQEAAAAAPLLRQAATLLEQSAERRPLPETHALLSIVYGAQIGADPSLGVSLGMLGMQSMSEAASMAPANPRVSLLRGMNALFTPEQYGGGLQVAQTHLAKAITLYQLDRPALGLPAWGRAEAHAWLGQVYQRGGDITRARAEYRTALALEPGYAWVRNGLLKE